MIELLAQNMVTGLEASKYLVVIAFSVAIVGYLRIQSIEVKKAWKEQRDERRVHRIPDWIINSLTNDFCRQIIIFALGEFFSVILAVLASGQLLGVWKSIHCDLKHYADIGIYLILFASSIVFFVIHIVVNPRQIIIAINKAKHPDK